MPVRPSRLLAVFGVFLFVVMVATVAIAIPAGPPPPPPRRPPPPEPDRTAPPAPVRPELIWQPRAGATAISTPGLGPGRDLARVPALPGWHDLAVHGALPGEDTVEPPVSFGADIVGGNFLQLQPDEVARMLLSPESGYDGGPVRLVACSASCEGSELATSFLDALLEEARRRDLPQDEIAVLSATAPVGVSKTGEMLTGTGRYGEKPAYWVLLRDGHEPLLLRNDEVHEFLAGPGKPSAADLDAMASRIAARRAIDPLPERDANPSGAEGEHEMALFEAALGRLEQLAGQHELPIDLDVLVDPDQRREIRRWAGAFIRQIDETLQRVARAGQANRDADLSQIEQQITEAGRQAEELWAELDFIDASDKPAPEHAAGAEESTAAGGPDQSSATEPEPRANLQAGPLLEAEGEQGRIDVTGKPLPGPGGGSIRVPVGRAPKCGPGTPACVPAEPQTTGCNGELLTAGVLVSCGQPEEAGTLVTPYAPKQPDAMVTTPAPAGTDVVITTPPPAERGPECLPGADASATCAPEEANDTVMMPTSGQAISGWVGASDSTVRSGVAGAPEQAADLLVSNPLVTMPSGFGVAMPSLEESAASAIQQVPGSPLKELLNRDASPPTWTPAAPPGGKALLAG